MRPDLHAAKEIVVALRARVARMHDDDLPLAEIHDALSTGYAQALAADAWLTETDQRLHELIDDVSITVRARELRTLARDHALFQAGLIALRGELSALRTEYDDLLSRSQTDGSRPQRRRITKRPNTGTPTSGG